MERSEFCRALFRLQRQVLLVGLTGGIAAGKSTVAAMLAQQYPVLEADRIAKSLYEDSDVVEQLRRRCPALFYQGKLLSQQEIAHKIFRDPQLKQCVERVLYPYVFAQLVQRTQRYVEAQVPVVIHESALLVEAHIAHCYTYIVCVAAPLECRKARVPPFLRDTWELRMQAQLPQARKCASAHYVIYNAGSRRQLEQQVRRLQSWLERQRRRLLIRR